MRQYDGPNFRCMRKIANFKINSGTCVSIDRSAAEETAKAHRGLLLAQFGNVVVAKD